MTTDYRNPFSSIPASLYPRLIFLLSTKHLFHFCYTTCSISTFCAFTVEELQFLLANRHKFGAKLYHTPDIVADTALLNSYPEANPLLLSTYKSLYLHHPAVATTLPHDLKWVLQANAMIVIKEGETERTKRVGEAVGECCRKVVVEGFEVKKAVVEVWKVVGVVSGEMEKDKEIKEEMRWYSSIDGTGL